MEPQPHPGLINTHNATKKNLKHVFSDYIIFSGKKLHIFCFAFIEGTISGMEMKRN